MKMFTVTQTASTNTLMKNWLDKKNIDIQAISQTQRTIEEYYSLRVWVDKVMKYYGVT